VITEMKKQAETGTALAVPQDAPLAENVNPRQALSDILAECDEETRAQLAAAIQAGQADIQPTTPFASIRQKAGPDELAGGLKFNDDREDLALPHDIIPIAVKDGRVCWTPDDMKSPPRCKSTNGITRMEGVPDPGIDINGNPVNECAKCIRSLWGRERNALAEKYPDRGFLYCDDEKPECPIIKNLLCCEPDITDAWILTVHGMSIKPLNSYLGRLKNRGIASFQIVMRLSTEYERTDKGDSYQFRFAQAGETPVAAVKTLVAQYPQMMQALTRDAEAFDRQMQRDSDLSNDGGENAVPLDQDGFPAVFDE
jgi:hypothetical protein